MRISRIFCWLILFVTGLMLVLPSGTVMAQEEKVDLSLRMLPGYHYRDVIPGKDNTLFVKIRNNGNKEITNIRFDSDKPEGWVVEFKPGTISYLGAGSSQTVDVNIIPGPNTGRGKYNITLLAEANETRTATSTMLRVEGGYSYWLWVGIGLAVLVIAGFVVIYFRFGRQ